ncbi:MAG: heme-binding domain-containing protein [Bryobacteraceae bacterium]
MRRKWVKIALFLVVAILGAAQFFPPQRTNPPSDPSASFEALAKPSPELAAIVERACRDCHSNRTVWPWYSRVAPVSWLVAGDVREGRENLNFSEWNLLTPEMSRSRMRKVCEEVKSGDMPPWSYTLVHSRAKLSGADVQALCTPAATPGP